MAGGCPFFRPTTPSEGLSWQPAKAQTVGQIPEFWIDILQVPLEALTMQTPPQVQSALNAEGRHNDTNTAVCQRQAPGGEAQSTTSAHALHPQLSGVCWRTQPRRTSRTPDSATETLGHISQWCGNDTENLHFFFFLHENGFAGCFDFSLNTRLQGVTNSLSGL